MKSSKNTDVSLRARADYLIFRPQRKANNNYFLEQLTVKMTKTPKLLGKTTSSRKSRGRFAGQKVTREEKLATRDHALLHFSPIKTEFSFKGSRTKLRYWIYEHGEVIFVEKTKV